jgi:four helix bundle protein
MQDPKRLKVRDEARNIAVATYRLTSTSPHHERLGLTSQMRRAAISIGSNVSEGCGAQGDRAMIAFLHHSVGSLNELEFQLEVAIDLE